MVNPAPHDPVPEVDNPLASKAASELFVRRHWQRRPVVIRQAFDAAALAALTAPRDAAAEPDRELSTATMWALAAEEATEARLIRRRGTRWSLAHGPFAADEQPRPDHKQWTLLVQSVDHHLNDASALLHRFNFLPQCRLDDLMISVAGDQGGVGPHKDSYDVFLLQLAGTRHWTLGAPGEHALQPDQPLRLVEAFDTTAEITVGPGDMLYVPPGWIHDGVAQGPCMTASIGFRAPTRAELLTAWWQACAERDDDEIDPTGPRQYRDKVSATTAAQWRRQPGQLPVEMMASLEHWLGKWTPTAAEMREFIGCYLTEPKTSVWFERPTPVQCRQFNAQAKRNGVQLDRRTRISFQARTIFINGEPWVSDRPLSAALKRLASQRRLDGDAFSHLTPDDQDSLSLWHDSGWLHPGQ